MRARLSVALVAEARSWIGTPYCHAASVKAVGCDCLGLVRGVWRAVLGAEPEVPTPYRAGWIDTPGEERLRDAARRHLLELSLDEFDAGDVLLFRWRDHLPAKHIGIATSKTQMVHAHEGACVAEIALAPWRRRLVHAFRFPMPQNEDEAR